MHTQIINYLKQSDMKTKELKITPPEGYEIDKENSSFECIKFKKKPLTYEDVAHNLFNSQGSYFISSYGTIHYNDNRCSEPNNATSQKQLEKLLAINKLMNVSKYLNGNWQPDWNDPEEQKFLIEIYKGKINIEGVSDGNSHIIYFKTPGLAKQAIDILGEDSICLANSTDW